MDMCFLFDSCIFRERLASLRLRLINRGETRSSSSRLFLECFKLVLSARLCCPAIPTLFFLPLTDVSVDDAVFFFGPLVGVEGIRMPLSKLLYDLTVERLVRLLVGLLCSEKDFLGERRVGVVGTAPLSFLSP